MKLSSSEEWNAEVKRMIACTSLRIVDWKIQLKTVSKELKDSTSEFLLWHKEFIRDGLKSDERLLDFLVKERTSLKAFLGN